MFRRGFALLAFVALHAYLETATSWDELSELSEEMFHFCTKSTVNLVNALSYTHTEPYTGQSQVFRGKNSYFSILLFYAVATIFAYLESTILA